MKKFLLLLSLLTPCLVACTPALTHGYVYDKQYQAAWVQYIPGHYYESCEKVGKSEDCTDEYLPGYSVYHPAVYYLELTSCSTLQTDGKCQTGEVEVDQYTYNNTKVDSVYGGN